MPCLPFWRTRAGGDVWCPRTGGGAALCKADPWPMGPGCCGPLGPELPTQEEPLQGFLSLTSGPLRAVFLLHQGRDPDVSPGPDLPRSDGEAGTAGIMKFLNRHLCSGPEGQHAVGVSGLGGPPKAWEVSVLRLWPVPPQEGGLRKAKRGERQGDREDEWWARRLGHQPSRAIGEDAGQSEA